MLIILVFVTPYTYIMVYKIKGGVDKKGVCSDTT